MDDVECELALYASLLVDSKELTHEEGYENRSY